MYGKKEKSLADKKFTIIYFIVLILAGCSFVSFASGTSPEFARTAEEWAVLEDNTLTWDEIDDLVKEYNPTVRINAAYYSSSALQAKNNRQVSETLLQMADQYDAMANSYDAEEDAAQSAAYRLKAEQLRQEADENVSDSEVLSLENSRTEKGIALQVRQQFVQYYKDLAKKAATEENIGYLEKFYRNKKSLYESGKSDEIDTLKALETLQEEKAALTECEAAVETGYRKLITMCGWKYSQEAQIGALPEYSEKEIIAVDSGQDMQKAVENSLTLKIDEKKIENSKNLKDAPITEKWESQKQADENNVKAAYQKAYTALGSAKTAYDNAVSSCKLKEKSWSSANKKKELGRMTEMDVLELEREWKNAEGEKNAAWYDLILARVNYDAVLNGYTEE